MPLYCRCAACFDARIAEALRSDVAAMDSGDRIGGDYFSLDVAQ